jgi:transposase
VWKAARAARSDYANQPKPRPRYVGIDEFSKGKGRNNYGLILVNLDLHRIIDVSDKGRTHAAMRELFGKIDRRGLRACAMDMCNVFRRYCRNKLKGVAIVIDRFHVVRAATLAVDETRRRIARDVLNKEQKKRYTKYKGLFLLGMEKLTVKQKQRQQELFACSWELLQAYAFKEWLRDVYHTAGNRDAARDALRTWIRHAYESAVEEVQRLAATVFDWREEILNFWDHRITNAVVEGKINKIREIGRAAYHYQDFGSFRSKLLEREQRTAQEKREEQSRRRPNNRNPNLQE